MSDEHSSAGPLPELTSPPPPQTQIPEIDEALASLASLPSATLTEQQERLSQVHAVLHQALNAEPSAVTS